MKLLPEILESTHLELMTVALQCFGSRTAGRPGGQYLPGDYSYAIMDLVSRRPKINPLDSAFLAFARQDACPSEEWHHNTNY